VRGQDSRNGSLFSYVDLEQRVRSDHPLRTIRILVNEALASLDGRFGEIYSEIGRPSIPPEQLLRAMLLQAFYSVRSERQLMEQLDFNLLFRWFVGLGIDDAVWDASTFSKNRLLEGSVAAAFLSAVLAIPRAKRLLSQDHFSVNGTLIQAWASMKSFRPKDGTPSEPPEPPAGGRNAEVDFHGQRLSNDTHRSSTDPEARLYRKGRGREAKLCFMGHLLMENRNGLIVDGSGWPTFSQRASGVLRPMMPSSDLASQASKNRRTMSALLMMSPPRRCPAVCPRRHHYQASAANSSSLLYTPPISICRPAVASGRNLRVESVLGFRCVVSRASLAHANRNFDCRLGI